MSTLTNKIDFAVVISVNRANPNGDPLNGNRPRQGLDRLGEISDVAIKRKIRNRLIDMGKEIFVQSDDRRAEDDNFRSLKARVEGVLGKEILRTTTPRKDLTDKACQTWLDVRAFGQVFPFKATTEKKSKGKGASDTSAEDEGGEDNKSVSASVRGPVSVHPAFSVAPVLIDPSQITKSVNLEGDGDKIDSDRMGMKHRVYHGVYVFYGSMNTQLATKTGFSDEDATDIKEALRTLFRNDESSARPAGSMEVYKVYWWAHNNPNGQYSSANVHRLLQVAAKVDKPTRLDEENYKITLGELPSLKCEVLDGE